MKNKVLIFFKTLLISLILISCSENNKLENVNKILLFGDSLMSGDGLKEDQTLSIILENHLKETGYNIIVISIIIYTYVFIIYQITYLFFNY